MLRIDNPPFAMKLQRMGHPFVDELPDLWRIVIHTCERKFFALSSPEWTTPRKKRLI